MTYKPVSRFSQWLWDNHKKMTTDLTWEDYNKLQIFYQNNVDKDRWTRIIESMQKEESV